MRRLMLLILLVLLPLWACAESLPECQTAEEVLAYLTFPQADENGAMLPQGVQAGMVRYISQHADRDPLFCADYWLGGEPGSELDLTQEFDPAGDPYTYHSSNMCTRAVYSMALSFLGVDVTPGDISRITGLRNQAPPYDNITEQLQVERVTHNTYIFQKMYESYITDPAHYSPIYVHLQKPNGVYHALLVVGREEGGRYLVVDCAAPLMNEENVYVYSMSFNPTVRSVVNSTFRRDYQESILLGFYQWKLKEE